MNTLDYNGKSISYLLYKDNVQILNSYLITTKQDMLNILQQIRENAESQGFVYKRNNISWLREWRAHNFLHDIGYKIVRVMSVDLNENETLLRRLGYFFLSLIYQKV